MKSIKRISLVLGVIAASMVSVSSYAQQISLEHKFRLDPVFASAPAGPYVSTEGPTEEQHFGDWALSLMTDYAYRGLVIKYKNSEGSLIGNSAVSRATFGLALGGGFAIDASLPVLLAQVGGYVVDDKSGLNYRVPGTTSLGDARLGLVYRHRLSGKWDYLFGVRGWAPTGNVDTYMSDDRVRTELIAGFAGVSGSFDAGCTGFVAPSIVIDSYTGDRLGASCAASIAVSKEGPHAGVEVLFSRLRYQSDLDQSTTVETWLSLRDQLGPIRLGLAAGPGFGLGPGHAAFRGILSLTYLSTGPDLIETKHAKPVLDHDFDGINDDQDACPNAAGPRSDDPKSNGCPKGDKDGDGILDDDDACPDAAGPKHNDPESNGCPDRDNDHVVDKLDKCPDQPAPVYDNTEKLGCPQYAVRNGDVLTLQPPLSVNSADQNPAVRAAELRELAFLIRSDDSIDVVSVEVSLHVDDENSEQALEVAGDAAKIAGSIIDELVGYGVLRERLQPVGAMTRGKPSVRFHVAKKNEEN